MDILNQNKGDWFNKCLGIVCVFYKLKAFVKICPAEFPIRLYIIIYKNVTEEILYENVLNSNWTNWPK